MTATVKLQNDRHLVDMQQKKIFTSMNRQKQILIFWLNSRMYFQFGLIFKCCFFTNSNEQETFQPKYKLKHTGRNPGFDRVLIEDLLLEDVVLEDLLLEDLLLEDVY